MLDRQEHMGPEGRLSVNDSELPRLYQQADAFAKSSQNKHLWLIRMDLGLGILGATIAFLSGLLPMYARELSLASAVVLISAVIFRSRLGFSSRVARWWLDSRSLAESVKTAAWDYSMRAGYFKHDATAGDEFHKYLTRLRRTAGREVVGHLPDVRTREQITEKMKAIRGLDDPIQRRDHYLRERLEDQEEYYERRAKDHEDSSRFWFILALGAEVLAVIAASLKALGVVTWNPIPLLVAIGGVATALNQLAKHDEIAHSYRITRSRLDDLRSELQGAATEDSLSKAVLDIESVMSREHKGWTTTL